MDKHELKYMTWLEADQAFRDNKVIIIPLGSMEVHGPHSPVGDFIAAEEVAVAAATKMDAVCAPVIPFGNSEYFRGFSGTISVRQSTLKYWVEDVIRSLTEHGVSKIFFLNGHAGNSSVLEDVSRALRREKGIIIPRLDMWQLTPASLKEEIFGPSWSKTGHGGGTVDTVMRYLHPEAMRLESYNPNETRNVDWNGFPLLGLGKSKTSQCPLFLPINMEDISQQGCLGLPLLGSAEGGKKLFDFFVSCVCELIKMMNNANMVVDGVLNENNSES